MLDVSILQMLLYRLEKLMINTISIQNIYFLTEMYHTIVTIIATVCCFLVLRATAEEIIQQNQQSLDLGNVAIEDQVDGDAIHTREKRTLFLKKKLLGAGLLGFGLGVAKG